MIAPGENAVPEVPLVATVFTDTNLEYTISDIIEISRAMDGSFWLETNVKAKWYVPANYLIKFEEKANVQ